MIVAFKSNKLSLPYIAGLMDGEGCITLLGGGKHQTAAPSPYVMITNTNLKVLKAIQATVGGYLTSRTSRGKNWKSTYQLAWYSWVDCQTILRKLRQWLIIKAPQADLLLSLPPRLKKAPRYIDDTIHWKALKKFRKLNKRGPK